MEVIDCYDFIICSLKYFIAKCDSDSITKCEYSLLQNASSFILQNLKFKNVKFITQYIGTMAKTIRIMTQSEYFLKQEYIISTSKFLGLWKSWHRHPGIGIGISTVKNFIFAFHTFILKLEYLFPMHINILSCAKISLEIYCY